MNKTMRNAGLIVLAAGALVYPAMLLYRYISNRRSRLQSEGEEQHPTKSILSAYRGNHKPHRRKAEANGHMAH